MTILKRQALWTLVAVIILGSALHFFLDAHQGYGHQRTELERVAFRRDFANRQITELQQKVKVIQAVNAFVGGAEDLGLVPANWTRYEVAIEAPLKFQALSEILQQCKSTPYYYFQPHHLKVHLAGQSSGDSAASGSASEAATATGPDGIDEQGDLYLQLKGTFLARRR